MKKDFVCGKCAAKCAPPFDSETLSLNFSAILAGTNPQYAKFLRDMVEEVKLSLKVETEWDAVVLK